MCPNLFEFGKHLLHNKGLQYYCHFPALVKVLKIIDVYLFWMCDKGTFTCPILKIITLIARYYINVYRSRNLSVINNQVNNYCIKICKSGTLLKNYHFQNNMKKPLFADLGYLYWTKVPFWIIIQVLTLIFWGVLVVPRVLVGNYNFNRMHKLKGVWLFRGLTL